MNGAIVTLETAGDSRRRTGPVVRFPEWAPSFAEEYHWNFDGDVLMATAERLFPLVEKVPKGPWPLDVNYFWGEFNQALAYLLFTDRRMEGHWRELGRRDPMDRQWELLLDFLARAAFDTDDFASGFDGMLYRQARSVAARLNKILDETPDIAFFDEVITGIEGAIECLNKEIHDVNRPSRPSQRTPIFMHLAWEHLSRLYPPRKPRDLKLERILATVTEIIVNPAVAEYSDDNLHRLLTRPWRKRGISANKE